MPKTREDFWKRKFETNVKRDTRNRRDLKKMGWDVLVVWECQTKSSKEDILRRKIICFLEH
jgi:DNA mismatch endonuclease (patch repair protein)